MTRNSSIKQITRIKQNKSTSSRSISVIYPEASLHAMVLWFLGFFPNIHVQPLTLTQNFNDADFALSLQVLQITCSM